MPTDFQQKINLVSNFEKELKVQVEHNLKNVGSGTRLKRGSRRFIGTEQSNSISNAEDIKNLQSPITELDSAGRKLVVPQSSVFGKKN